MHCEAETREAKWLHAAHLTLRQVFKHFAKHSAVHSIFCMHRRWRCAALLLAHGGDASYTLRALIRYAACRHTFETTHYSAALPPYTPLESIAAVLLLKRQHTSITCGSQCPPASHQLLLGCYTCMPGSGVHVCSQAVSWLTQRNPKASVQCVKLSPFSGMVVQDTNTETHRAWTRRTFAASQNRLTAGSPYVSTASYRIAKCAGDWHL